MTVLVTGSSGFIGSRLVAKLKAQGHRVRVLDRSRHDLCRPETLDGICDDISVVYHLAAYAHVNQIDIKLLRDTNIGGTRHLVQAAIDAGVPRVVLVSSVLADPTLDEPRTAYGDSKLQAEELLQQAHNAGDLTGVILRPVNVYGVGMRGNLMTLMRLIAKGIMPPLPRFEASLSLVGVDDLCEAIMLAGKAPAATETPVLPVTDGQTYAIKDLEAAIREALGKPVPQWATPTPLFYMGALSAELMSRWLRLRNGPGMRSYRALSQGQQADNSKAREYLGYNPRSTFYRELPAIVARMAVGHAQGSQLRP